MQCSPSDSRFETLRPKAGPCVQRYSVAMVVSASKPVLDILLTHWCRIVMLMKKMEQKVVRRQHSAGCSGCIHNSKLICLWIAIRAKKNVRFTRANWEGAAEALLFSLPVNPDGIRYIHSVCRLNYYNEIYFLWSAKLFTHLRSECFHAEQTAIVMHSPCRSLNECLDRVCSTIIL